MAGLLKQLQKSKRPVSDARTAVLIAPDEVSVNTKRENIRGTKRIDKRFSEAEKLFSDLTSESSTPVVPAAEAGPGGKVVKRHVERKAAGKEESLPTWARIEKKLSAQAEMLLGAAIEEARSLLSGSSFRDAPDLLKQSVELAQGKIHQNTNWKDAEIVEKELVSLVLGKGPLQPLFDDAFVTEIFIDHYAGVKVRRKDQLIETPFSFRSNAEYELFVQGLLREHELGFFAPIVDCIVDDKWHSRVNAIHQSVTNAEGPRLCIRVPRQHKISFYDLLQSKTLPATLAAWLAEIVVLGEANILIVGPSGSGKTLLATALASEIGSDERVITIEEMPEIFVANAALEKLIQRPAGVDGSGGVTLAQLMNVALRRNPERFIVGEIRDEEARGFLRALERGYSGSIATIHGDYSEDALGRYLDILAVHERAPQVSLMRRLTRSIHLIIAMGRVDDRPALVEVAEVLPLSGPNFTLQPLVRFEGVQDGKRIWRLMTGRSYWLDRTSENGVGLRSGPALLPVEQPG